MRCCFVTGRTHGAQRAFAEASAAHAVIGQLLQSASRYGFGVPAYCLMPDHAHVLFRPLSERSRLLSCVAHWRQCTGYGWRRARGTRLWQEGYWDRVLRATDDELRCAAYIVNNPVRAGLVEAIEEYPFIGSTDYSIQQLAEAALDAAVQGDRL